MNEFKVTENFRYKYQAAIQLFEKAKKRLAEGDADDTLTAARKSLEFFVKDFCKNCGLPIEDDSGLPIKSEDLINSLKDTGLFDEQEISLLHSIRKLGNVGSHELASFDKAQEVVPLLEKAVEVFAERDNKETFTAQKAHNNVPMKNSNYYDPKRKYMGEWAFCYSREDLFCIPEYVELYHKAEQGDISAMLDLAIGFLPKKDRVWGKDQLVCMPKYRSYYNDEFDAIDARYYYWIVRACNNAVECHYSGLEYPKKYMATALFEALKFVLRWDLFPVGNYISAVHGNQFTYSEQFDLVDNIYGNDEFQKMSIAEWAILLLLLVQEHGFEIIDPLHEAHRTPDNIRFIVGCLYYYYSCEVPDSVCSFFELQSPIMTVEHLEAIKPADGSCDEYYNACLKIKEKRHAKEQEQARLAAEQQAQEEAERETTAREAAAQKAKEEATMAQEAERKARAEAQKARKRRRRGFFCFLLIAVATFFIYSKATGYEPDWCALIPNALEDRFQVETIDPFEDLEIRVIGAAPDIRVELWDNSLHSFMQEVTFKASKTEGLEKGDVIKVVANYDKMEAFKAGYRLEPTTMTYTIDQVNHYTRSCEEIEREVWKAMYTQAADMIETYIADRDLNQLCNDISGSGYYSRGLSCNQSAPELERVFFLNLKPGFSEDSYNKCYLILRTPLTFTINYTGEVCFDGYGYFAVGFTNLLDEPSGITKVNLSNGTLVGSPEGNADSIYSENISVYKAKYAVEEILGENIDLLSVSED